MDWKSCLLTLKLLSSAITLYNARTFWHFSSWPFWGAFLLRLRGQGFHTWAISPKFSLTAALVLHYLSPPRKGKHFVSILAQICVKRLPPCVTARITTSCVQERRAVVWDAGTTKDFQMSRILSRVAEPHDLLYSHFLCSAVICRLASTARSLLCLYQPMPTEF